MNKNKELLFSITKKDFIIEPYKGRGNGGQKRNKTMSCVRIRHPESGAEAIGTEHREQKRNRDAAFNRLIKTKKFNYVLIITFLFNFGNFVSNMTVCKNLLIFLYMLK